MWRFILGVFVGANISLFLYAIILAGARSEKNNEWRTQSKLLCNDTSIYKI